MEDRTEERAGSDNQEIQKRLVEDGMRLPGVAEAMAVYAAATRRTGSMRVAKPVVRFATGGNS